VYQLDFFPRKEFQSLGDFQRLDRLSLSLEERRQLSQTPQFFNLQKSHEIISHEHSQIIDRILGFRMKYVEEMLVAEASAFDPNGSHDSWGPLMHKGVQTWVGLDLVTLQTPYSEMAQIFSLLKLRPYQQVIDLGAAYGRMGALIGGLYPKALFTGYEYVKARVDEGNRVYRELGLTNCQLVEQDLFDREFHLPEADLYFIYDYGQVEHINHTLNQIHTLAKKRPVRLIVRGKYTRQIIDAHHPWLDVAYEGKRSGSYVIYQAHLRGYA
jgi:hypothetical protein